MLASSDAVVPVAGLEPARLAALDFELFAPHGTQTNSASCGGRCRTPKSLANTTVFEADMQKSSVSSAIFALFDLDGIFGFWRDTGGMLPTNRAQQHTQ